MLDEERTCLSFTQSNTMQTALTTHHDTTISAMSSDSMRKPSSLMMLLFRTTYLYTIIIYTACAVLGFPGSMVALAATGVIAVSAEVAFVWNAKEEASDSKELRYMV